MKIILHPWSSSLPYKQDERAAAVKMGAPVTGAGMTSRHINRALEEALFTATERAALTSEVPERLWCINSSNVSYYV